VTASLAEYCEEHELDFFIMLCLLAQHDDYGYGCRTVTTADGWTHPDRYYSLEALEQARMELADGA
jgi:hypothetical protein